MEVPGVLAGGKDYEISEKQWIWCNEPQGKLTGYIFWKVLDEQRKFYYSGIWTCDLRIDVLVLYQLS